MRVAADATVTVVDCGVLHTGEVTAAWTTVPADPPGTAFARCQTATAAYLAGLTDVGPAWSWPRPASALQVVSGPGPTFRAGWSWTACLVTPTAVGVTVGGGYTGLIVDQLHGRPPLALRPCFSLNQTGVQAGERTVGLAPTPCSGPHSGEELGALIFRRAVSGVSVDDVIPDANHYVVDHDPDRAAGCVDVARERTGATDPSYGHRLAIVVRVAVIGETVGRQPDRASPARLDSIDLRAVCSVESASTAALTASVLDLADGRPPLSPR